MYNEIKSIKEPTEEDCYLGIIRAYQREVDNLQQENQQLKEDKKKVIECIHLFGIYKDTPDKGLDIRKILKNILEILGDKE